MLTYFQGSHKEQNRAACGGMREYETAWGITVALSRLAGETSGAYISLGSTAGYPEYQLAYELNPNSPFPLAVMQGSRAGRRRPASSPLRAGACSAPGRLGDCGDGCGGTDREVDHGRGAADPGSSGR